jgi:hypothetical protein
MCAIRDLKRQGFEILAYEDGSECWSVKLKCLSLLAGAGQLLDSGDTHFGCRFQSALTQIHNAEAKKQEEDQKTALVMCSMGMVGSSAAMMSVFRSVIRFSTLSDLPVLIGGEFTGWIQSEGEARLSQSTVARLLRLWQRANFSDTAEGLSRAPTATAKA